MTDSAKIDNYPIYFTYAGRIRNNQLYDAGSAGYYWSSEKYSSGTNIAQNLYIGTGTGFGGYDVSYNYMGQSVRCVMTP